MSESKTLILNNDQVYQKINRIAYQIFEDNYTEKEILVVGIANNGYLFARELVDSLKKISEIDIKLVKLTIHKENPTAHQSTIDINTDQLSNKVIILVDDVLNTGKALIYGVKFLLDFPIKKMSTTVLVDRNHKKFPIGTHYVGLSLSTTLKSHISVEFTDNKIAAYLD